MAAITFAAELKADGSLTVPGHALDELGMKPGDRVRVRVEAADDSDERAHPTPLSRARHQMTHRTPEQIAEARARAMETYRPARSVPRGKTLADMVSGQWPGDETDEQIEAALRELS